MRLYRVSGPKFLDLPSPCAHMQKAIECWGKRRLACYTIMHLSILNYRQNVMTHKNQRQSTFHGLQVFSSDLASTSVTSRPAQSIHHHLPTWGVVTLEAASQHLTFAFSIIMRIQYDVARHFLIPKVRQSTTASSAFDKSFTFGRA